MCRMKVQCPTNDDGTPMTNRQRRMNKFVARLCELLSQLRTEDRHRTNGNCISDEAARQRQQLWQNITNDAVEDQPYGQWLTEGKWHLTELPETRTVENVANIEKKESRIPTKKLRRKGEKLAKDKMHEDMRNGGVAARKAVKGALGAKKEYVQPTHTIQVEGGVTSNPSEVHKAFAEEWPKKVFRLHMQKLEWEEFKKTYGQCIPQAPYKQGGINGEDLLKVVQGMGRTVPGLDGWRIHELKALGLDVWTQRARIVKVQLKTGKVLASYKQVNTPMMPKSKGTEKITDHRGLAIFSIL